MAREKLDALNRNNRGLRGYQGFFLALTLIVMVIIVLMTEKLTTAILIIGLIANFLIISAQLTFIGDRHVSSKSTKKDGEARLSKINQDMAASVMVNPVPGLDVNSANLMESLVSREGMVRRPDTRPPHAKSHLDTPPRGASRSEAFTTATTAPPGAGPPSFPNVPDTSFSENESYPGAIDFGQTDEMVVGDEAPALGHTDWDAAARDNVPEGNPFDVDRIASPQAAGPCVDDDALALYDGDELNTLQVRSRNNPERVWAGIYRRKALIDRYVGEELDEEEGKRWWGNHEV